MAGGGSTGLTSGTTTPTTGTTPTTTSTLGSAALGGSSGAMGSTTPTTGTQTTMPSYLSDNLGGATAPAPTPAYTQPYQDQLTSQMDTLRSLQIGQQPAVQDTYNPYRQVDPMMPTLQSGQQLLNPYVKPMYDPTGGLQMDPIMTTNAYDPTRIFDPSKYASLPATLQQTVGPDPSTYMTTNAYDPTRIQQQTLQDGQRAPYTGPNPTQIMYANPYNSLPAPQPVPTTAPQPAPTQALNPLASPMQGGYADMQRNAQQRHPFNNPFANGPQRGWQRHGMQHPRFGQQGQTPQTFAQQRAMQQRPDEKD